VTFQQPLIAPLYDGRQAIEVLAAMNGAVGVPAADLVKDTDARVGGKTKNAWTLHDMDGKLLASADAMWRHALHDGFLRAHRCSTESPESPESWEVRRVRRSALPHPAPCRGLRT
jgi:hypothetical protein